MLYIAKSHLAMRKGDPLRAMTWRRLAAIYEPDEAAFWYLTADAAPNFFQLPSLGERAGQLGCQ